MSVTVASIRRFPVKAMIGETLPSVVIDNRGLAGDRWFAVRDGDGRFAACKTTRRFRRRDAVVAFRARTDASARVWVGGPMEEMAVGDPALDAHLTRAMGSAVTVAAESDVSHQDAAPVSLVGTATLDWCMRRWGIDADPRRLRVNLLLRTAEPFVEEQWVGRDVRVGDAVLVVTARAVRCRTVDVAQDGVDPAGRLLPRLAAERDTCIAVYAAVVRPGRVTTAAPVELEGSG